MSNSGYDPFEYGLIKPEEEDSSPVPQGDPEDMLFSTEGAASEAGLKAASGPDPFVETAQEARSGPDDAEDMLFDGAAQEGSAESGLVFDSAPPPTFEEKAPVKRKERPSRLSVGRSTPVEAAPPPTPGKSKSPPWLRDGAQRSQRQPSHSRKEAPESRLALKVASPGASHHRRAARSGSKLLPLTVLLGGVAGGAYCYLVLEQMILAGLVCAMGLIGSMFCAVLLRSKPL